MITLKSSLPKLNAGGGRIVLRSHGADVAFLELSATYPLKLLSPRVAHEGVAIAYVLSYGGGLVGGDHIRLVVDVGPAAVLLLLSQGSTKVFKTRLGTRAAQQCSPICDPARSTTWNVMDVTISAKGAVFLLPDPVTCFRSAAYNQVQTFRLSGDASVALLDWITSGRKSLGEEWAFSRYYSMNEVWVDGVRVARDVMLLEDSNVDGGGSGGLGARLAPYSCYATVLLYGPLTQNVIRHLSTLYSAISVFKTQTPVDLIWSLSMIASNAGCLLRVAGKETELVKVWLRNALRGLEEVVGLDVYQKAFV